MILRIKEVPRELWGTVLERKIMYQEFSIIKLPGPVLRWGTIHDYLVLKMAHKSTWRAKRWQLKDQVPTADQAPAYTDMISCEECGIVYFVPDIDQYPGGMKCPNCLPIIMTQFGPCIKKNGKLISLNKKPKPDMEHATLKRLERIIPLEKSEERRKKLEDLRDKYKSKLGVI